MHTHMCVCECVNRGFVNAYSVVYFMVNSCRY